MDYDIKKGHASLLEGDGLRGILEEVFGSVKEKEGLLVTSYGALSSIEAKLLSKNTLMVNTTSNPDVDDNIASETIRRYNTFLERATGFNSKQRRDRLQKKAKDGKL